MSDIILNNRYRLGKQIGVGGMAVVHEADDLVLKRKVAIKILKQQFVDDEEFLKKFQNEAQSAAALTHPNIVNVYDVGSQVVDGKKLHYIVMELVEGTTLKDVIEVQGRLSDSAISRISIQIARALECAHDHNIVHRDIKPANILIMSSGNVKVADFGIARISSTATITYTNSILGTVHYISPEQAKGRYIDQKSDIYSLGVVMYEMATGHVPFDAENSVGIAIKHIQEEPPAPIDDNPRLSPGLNAIILRCLRKDPNERYYNAQELIRALESYKTYAEADTEESASGDTIHIKAVNPREVTYESKRPIEDFEEEPRKSGGRWKWLLLLAIFAIVAAAGMIFLLQQSGNKMRNEEMTTVPDLYNMKEDEALTFLKDQGLRGVVVNRVSDPRVEKGRVIDQSIPAKTPIKKGERIDLTVSDGVEKIRVPDVTNKMQSEAEQSISAAGLQIDHVEFANSDDIEKDRVIKTDPPRGTQLEPGSKVVIYVSKGKLENMTTVPMLENQDQVNAINLLRQMDLTIGSITPEHSATQPEGKVIRQSIDPGSRVEKGTKVDIVISSGPEEPIASSESSEPPQSSESSSTAPPPESSEASSEQPVEKKFNLILTPPADKDSFTVTIFDKSVDTDTPIFEKLYQKSEVGPDGKIHLTIQGTVHSDFLILYDGKPASTVGNP